LYLGVSFADATLYGNIDQAYTNSKVTLGSSTKAQRTNITAYQNGQSLLGVKGAEDLGDGLKASYLYEFGLATETTAAPTNRQSYVGLSGGFGALRVGKQYSQAFDNAVAVDPAGADGAPGNLYIFGMVSYDATANPNTYEVTGGEHPLRQDRGIQYDLPTFVPGLKLGITKVFGNANSANNGAKVGDGTGFNASYSANGIYAGFTTDSVKGQGIIAGTGLGYTAQPTDNSKLTTLAFSYNLGMAKPSYQNTKITVGSNTWKTDMFALSVPLGAATVYVSTSTGKMDLAGTASDFKAKGMQYGVNYGLSKRTTAYWHAGNSTITPTLAGASALKTTGFGIGVNHSF